MKEAITVSNVSKHFHRKTAVNHISFSIEKGEIAAILGPNGAGKTTVISMILGLLKPSEGEIKLFNRVPDDQLVREKIGVMLQEVSVMPGLKVDEILELFRVLSESIVHERTRFVNSTHQRRFENKSRKIIRRTKTPFEPCFGSCREPGACLYLMNRQSAWILHQDIDSGRPFTDCRTKEKQLFFQLIIYKKQTMPHSESYFLLKDGLLQTTHQCKSAQEFKNSLFPLRFIQVNHWKGCLVTRKSRE